MGCIWGIGDCGSKSDNRSITNTKNIEQAMANMVSSTSSSTYVKVDNVQSNDITILAPPGSTASNNIKYCTVKNNQNMDFSQNVKVSLDLRDETTLKNQIKSALKSANETAQKNNTEFLATAGTTLNNYTEVDQLIEKLVSNNVTKSLYDDLKQFMSNLQENKILLEGPIECVPGTSIVENVQTMVLKQVTDKLTKALMGTTVDNVFETNIENTNTTDQQGDSGGAPGLIDSFFSGLSELISSPIMIIGVIVIVLVVLVYVFRGAISKTVEKKAGAFGAMLFGRKKSRFGSKRW